MAQPQGTGFSNLQNLIAANQGNPLASNVQNGVQRGISGLQTNLNNSQQQFQSDVNNSSLGNQANQQYVQNTIGSIVNSPANINAPQGQTAPQPGQVSTQVSQPNASDTSPTGPTSSPSSSSPAPTPMFANINQPTTSGLSQAPQAPAPTSASQQQPSASPAPGSFGQTPAPTAQAAATPAGPSAADLSKFAQFIAGGYSGPSQLQNYSGLLSQSQNLQNLGQNANT